MLVPKALRSEIASAFLAASVAGMAAPAFAQDSNAPVLETPDALEQNQTFTESGGYVVNSSGVPDIFFWALAIGLIGGTAAYTRYRGTDGATTRTIAVAALFGGLAAPQTITDEYQTLPSVIPVFMDESMSVGDRAPLVEEAFAALETSLASLGSVSLHPVTFGSADDIGLDRGTNLAGAFETGLNSVPRDQIGGSVVITDGVLSDQSQFMDIPGIENPVHALIVGHEEEQDFYVQIEQAPRTGIIGEDQEITYRIVDGRGDDSEYEEASVNFYFGGNAVRSMTVPLNEAQTISLSELAPEGLQIGTNLVEIEIDEIQGAGEDLEEVSMLNNSNIINIQGIDSSIDILYLSGTPHIGTRLWSELMMDDPNINLVHIGYQLPLAKEDATPLRELATTAFPVREIFRERLPEFDAVIIDSRAYNGVVPLLEFSYLSDYITSGGGFIYTGAEELVAPNSLARTMLGDILPLTPTEQTIDTRFIPQVTDIGQRTPLGRTIMNAGINPESWGPWYSVAGTTLNGDATVVMTDQGGNPLLALTEAGQGRVAMLASDQNALWARGHEGGGPADTLYRSMIGWVTGNPAYEEENLTVTQQGDEIIIELQTMEDSAETVIVTTPSGEEIEVMPEQSAPGLFTARLPAEETGAYRARRASSATTQALAGARSQNRTEIEQVVAETEIIRPLTDRSGGETVRVADKDGNLVMPSIIRAGDERPESGAVLEFNMGQKRELVGSTPNPILPPWAYLLAFAGFAIASFRQKEIVDFVSGKNRKDKTSPEPKPEA